ncbi:MULTISPECIES: hypothetical protein [unclassified Moorena]|uniref:hypothetical protein n=1 Tax=unclassified Moorena TaxID=2683338 RepID=UPI00338EE30F
MDLNVRSRSVTVGQSRSVTVGQSRSVTVGQSTGAKAGLPSPHLPISSSPQRAPIHNFKV